MKSIVAIRIARSAALALVLAATAHASDDQKSAESWQKQAKDTRAQVVSVAQELEELGAADHEAASGLLADAKRWLAKGDAELDDAGTRMEAGDYEKASSTYNMAWQYYVKAATAGLNARRILTGR